VRRGLYIYASLMYLFFYLPLLVLTVFSVNASRVAIFSGFSFRWYRQLLADGGLFDATMNSLVIASAATLIATMVGTAAAYAIWKRPAPVFTSGLYLSLVTPEIVTGVSLLVFFQALFRVLPIRLGLHTVVLAHVAFSLVYVVSVVLARLRTFDKTLEEAGADLGGTEWDVFRLITLPQLMPGIAAAALLCFTVSFDDYVITSMVAGVDSETLPMVIYAMARKGVSPEINALSTIITVGLGILVLIAGRLERSQAGRV
jgi:spermidine/putrescine transport system permease protein